MYCYLTIKFLLSDGEHGIVDGPKKVGGLLSGLSASRVTDIGNGAIQGVIQCCYVFKGGGGWRRHDCDD
jgi:hypothetical protein